MPKIPKPDEKTWVSSDQGCLALASPYAYRNKRAEMQFRGRWSYLKMCIGWRELLGSGFGDVGVLVFVWNCRDSWKVP